ncbi:MAG: ribosomal L7Ae/L30e/S12e/Gadd45 family protein [Negativicutes bacterium]|nr:ribosomal L7Ae/L30e/S12e/Gadd45 family protein [Negativicutes bacterium]
MPNKQKLASLIGLAQKAGKIASGDFAVERAVKTGKANLMIIAGDASENTKKGYRDLANYYRVACYEALDKTTIGNSIGKPQRAVLVFLDAGFSLSARKLLETVD